MLDSWYMTIMCNIFTWSKYLQLLNSNNIDKIWNVYEWHTTWNDVNSGE